MVSVSRSISPHAEARGLLGQTDAFGAFAQPVENQPFLGDIDGSADHPHGLALFGPRCGHDRGASAQSRRAG